MTWLVAGGCDYRKNAVQYEKPGLHIRASLNTTNLSRRSAMSTAKCSTQIPAMPEIQNVEIRNVSAWPGYAVGDDGSVWSCKNPGGQTKWFPWRKLTPILDPDGYPFVNLSGQGRRRRIKVCVLVLETFVSPRPNGMECRHFPDRDRTNNRLTNLRWGTNSENKQDSVRDGTCSLLRDDIRHNGQYRKGVPR